MPIYRRLIERRSPAARCEICAQADAPDKMSDASMNYRDMLRP